MAEPEWKILINFNKSPPSKSKGDFYHMFLTGNIKVQVNLLHQPTSVNFHQDIILHIPVVHQCFDIWGCVDFFRYSRNNINNRITGKISPNPMPILILFPAFWVIRPTIPGPMLPPKSPAMARRENIAVPPVGKVFEEILIVPGHMIPTENPHAIQPISPIIGLDDKAASR